MFALLVTFLLVFAASVSDVGHCTANACACARQHLGGNIIRATVVVQPDRAAMGIYRCGVPVGSRPTIRDKPAVTAIVVFAAYRTGSRGLKSRAMVNRCRRISCDLCLTAP